MSLFNFGAQTNIYEYQFLDLRSSNTTVIFFCCAWMKNYSKIIIILISYIIGAVWILLLNVLENKLPQNLEGKLSPLMLEKISRPLDLRLTKYFIWVDESKEHSISYTHTHTKLWSSSPIFQLDQNCLALRVKNSIMISWSFQLRTKWKSFPKSPSEKRMLTWSQTFKPTKTTTQNKRLNELLKIYKKQYMLTKTK